MLTKINQRMLNPLDAPSDPDDAATRSYVDTLVSGYDAADFADISHQVNTVEKTLYKMAWDTTNNRLMIASGTDAADPWFFVAVDGSVTPA